jgi:hypothetical protein
VLIVRAAPYWKPDDHPAQRAFAQYRPHALRDTSAPYAHDQSWSRVTSLAEIPPSQGHHCTVDRSDNHPGTSAGTL